MSTRNHRENRSHRAIKRYITILSVLMVLMTLIAASASARPVAPADFEEVNDSSIWLDGPVQATKGEVISYDVTTDVTGLFGIQFELSFDPAVLQVDGTQVTPGSCPEPDLVVQNIVDNVAGSISYAVISLAPTAPCDGGIVASFDFQVSVTAAAGTTPVQFGEVILADLNGIEIPATAVDLDLEILETIAEFSATPLLGPAALTVDFTNLSTLYDTCTWDFGDSVTSPDCNDPSHTYATKGVYTVSLTVDKSGGDSDTEIKTDYITVMDPVMAEFSGTPTVGLAPLTVHFTNLSTGDVSTCLWEFGDGDSDPSCGNPTHLYTLEDSYDVSLTVDGLGGDSDTVTKIDYIVNTQYLLYLPVILR